MSHARASYQEEPSGEANVPVPLRAAVARRAARDDVSNPHSQHILAAAADGIISFDTAGFITFVNPAAARIMGYSVDELVGEPIHSHLQFARAAAGLDEFVAPPLDENVCWRDDGSSFPIECEFAPLSEDGHVVGTVVTFRDISRRRAVEQMKDERIAVVSHELRTPLTSIRSALGLLASGLMGAQAAKSQRLLEVAVSNTDRLIRLVNELLDLERLDAGQSDMRRELCDVAELISQAVEGVRPIAHTARVSLDVRASSIIVWGDSDRLVQVLTNLLSNAIKFSPDGGGTVWVESEHMHDEAIIRVRDEGRGIPAQMLESIFEPFQQVEDADAREKGGTGLGLAISRGIVMQHQGQIWAESTVGMGTTICVALACANQDRVGVA
jgi:PAS domain S-box-containing protein